MEGIVFFGKGGVGKSTIASNITAIMSRGGGKVLHVGCDPKMDSTLPLMGRHIKPFSLVSDDSINFDIRKSIYPAPIKGVYCIEAGGPQPGVGCAGVSISLMLNAIGEADLLKKEGYDTVVFDVLGDVVCGGFAAPLRRGFAKKVVIITSEDIPSLYAANRLITMINNYSRNGVSLAGLAVNTRREDGVHTVEDFAKAVNTRILGVVLWNPMVAIAEQRHQPAILASPKSDFTKRVIQLCSAIMSAGVPEISPRAMATADFLPFAEGKKHLMKNISPITPRKYTKGSSSSHRPKSILSLFESVGFKPSGIHDNQIICDWKSSKGIFRILIVPAYMVQEGMIHFSDWGVCFHPSSGKIPKIVGSELHNAVMRLAALRFDEMFSTFTGEKDVCSYSKMIASSGPKEKELTAPDTPAHSYIGFEQWQRFIFPDSQVFACIPPGAVIVEHGDIECRFSCCNNDSLGMFGDDPYFSGKQPLLPKAEPCIVNTDFQSGDAIFGDEKKILKSLYKAADKVGPGGLIEFYVTCNPILLGSDIYSLAYRVEREKGVKIVIENYNNFHEHSATKTPMRVNFIANKLSRTNNRKKTYDVNLIDFDNSFSNSELYTLLIERGISVVEQSKDFYSAAGSSRLQVISQPDKVLSLAFDKAGMNWILPSLPYGLAGTNAWLSSIANVLGLKMTVGLSADQKAIASELWRCASHYAVGFVLEAEEVNLLFNNTVFRGIPILSVLAEAGFKIRLFIMDKGSKKTVVNTARLKTLLPGHNINITAKFFKTLNELHTLLCENRALCLIYSDVRRDLRVVSAGKNSFSKTLFEPGYAGAIETWRRLIELCKWNFNERYLLSK